MSDHPHNTEFLSTLSLRRATFDMKINGLMIGYFYPRSPCGERLGPVSFFNTQISISIHALLAESDAHNFATLHDILISIHALLAESDINCKAAEIVKTSFLSTLSLRRATVKIMNALSGLKNFYPRSPCGERPYLFGQRYNIPCISIHALLAESDRTQSASLSA